MWKRRPEIDIGIAGVALAAQEEGLVLAGLLALGGGIGRRLVLDRHVADRVLVDLDLELLFQRHGVEARGLFVLRVDQRLRHAVAREVIEAHVLEGVAQLRGSLFGGAWLAGEEVCDIDQRNLAADQHGRYDGIDRAGNDLVHGEDSFAVGVKPCKMRTALQ